MLFAVFLGLKGEVPSKTKEDLIAFTKPLGLTGKDIAEALKKAGLEFDPPDKI